MKTLVSCIAILLFSLALVAAENPVAGTWNCTAKPSNGGEIKVTLSIKEAEGKLSGGLVMESGDEIPISEAKLEGSNFTFKFFINGSPYTVELKLDSGKMAGKYSGAEASGTLEATKKS